MASAQMGRSDVGIFNIQVYNYSSIKVLPGATGSTVAALSLWCSEVYDLERRVCVALLLIN